MNLTNNSFFFYHINLWKREIAKKMQAFFYFLTRNFYLKRHVLSRVVCMNVFFICCSIFFEIFWGLSSKGWYLFYFWNFFWCFLFYFIYFLLIDLIFYFKYVYILLNFEEFFFKSAFSFFLQNLCFFLWICIEKNTQ